MAEYGETLSARELDVLGCIINGASNKDVAAELHISQNTVKVHLRNVYTKLGASSRTEAVTIAVQQGIITIPGTEIVPEDEPDAEDDEIVEDETATSTNSVQAVSTLSSEPIPPAERAPEIKSSRNWLLYGALSIVGLILLLTAVILAYQTFFPTVSLNPTTQPATPELFIEEAIAQTQWYTSRPLTQPLADMAVTSVGIDVYHIGGETETGVTNLVKRFDTSTRTWHDMAAKPTAVSAASAAVLFGEIYVPGGRATDGKPTNIVEAYSPANNAWRPIANLPKPISDGLALSDGSYLYMVGGWDGTQYVDDVYLYDATSDSWRPLTNLPQSLASATGGVISGKLYIVGGTDESHSALDSCFVYAIDEDSWSDCPTMLAPRKDAGAAIILNKLYVLGGDEPVGSDLPFGEFYDPSTQTWHVVNTPMQETAVAWSNLGVTNVETKIYAWGGNMGGILSDGNYIYSPLVYQTFIPAASGGATDAQP